MDYVCFELTRLSVARNGKQLFTLQIAAKQCMRLGRQFRYGRVSKR